ncbi:hypothetical protein T484DRAFT_1553985, partial [Baffinella frigidus]
GAEDMQKVLDYQGFVIEQTDKFGKTMLQSVASGHSMGGVLVCIDAGADVNSVDNQGNTALHLAIRSMVD